MPQELTLDRQQLTQMMESPVWRNLIPALELLRQSYEIGQGCGGCGAAANKVVPRGVSDDTINQIKFQMMNYLSGKTDLQKKIKEMLKVDTVRVKYISPGQAGYTIRKF